MRHNCVLLVVRGLKCYIAYFCPVPILIFFFRSQVSAEDPDCGVNAIVNYTIGESVRRFREFEIRPVSGDICISGRLDHETRSVYEFPVVATDRGEFIVIKGLGRNCN